jgi:hypothetical protein
MLIFSRAVLLILNGVPVPVGDERGEGTRVAEDTEDAGYSSDTVELPESECV